MRQTCGKHNIHPNTTGFSLLELLLVLGLLTVAMAVTVPALSRWQRRLPLEKSAALLQQALAETRLASIQSGEPWGLWLYAAGTHGRRTPLHQPDLDRYQFQFPPGIVCRPAPIQGEPNSAGTEDMVLVFQPDGSSSTARLLLTDARGETLQVVLERLTGSAGIRPAAAGSEKSSPPLSALFRRSLISRSVKMAQRSRTFAASDCSLFPTQQLRFPAKRIEFEPPLLLLNWSTI